MASVSIEQRRIKKLDLSLRQTLFDTLERLLETKEFKDPNAKLMLINLLDNPDHVFPDYFLPLVSYLKDKNNDVVKLVRCTIGMALIGGTYPELVKGLRRVVRNGFKQLLIELDLANLDFESWKIVLIILGNVSHLTELDLCRSGLEKAPFRIVQLPIERLPNLIQLRIRETSLHALETNFSYFGILLEKLPEGILLDLSEDLLGESQKDVSRGLISTHLKIEKVAALDLRANNLAKFGTYLPTFFEEMSKKATLLKSLNLSDNGLDKSDSKTFSKIALLKSVRILDLSRNGWGHCAVPPFQALQGLLSLRALMLNWNSLSKLSAEGWQSFGRLISNLKSLEIKGNGLGNSKDAGFDYKAFSRALSLGKKLEELDLSENDLHHLTLESEPLWHSFSSLLRLKKINFSGNNLVKIGSKSVQTLSKILSGISSLQVVDLSDNNLGEVDSDATWAEFCKAIRRLDQVGTLKLGGNALNKLSHLNWRLLIEAICAMKSLVTLDLSRNALGEMTKIQWDEVYLLQKSRQKLCDINLSSNKLGLQCVEVTNKLFRMLGKLSMLDLRENSLETLTDDDKSDFQIALLQVPNLISFNMSLVSSSYQGLLQELSYDESLSFLISIKHEIAILYEDRKSFKLTDPADLFGHLNFLFERYFRVTNHLSEMIKDKGKLFNACYEMAKSLWDGIYDDCFLTCSSEQMLPLLRMQPDYHPFFTHFRFLVFSIIIRQKNEEGVPEKEAFYTALLDLIHNHKMIDLSQANQAEFDNILSNAIFLNPTDQKRTLTLEQRVGFLRYLWLNNIKNQTGFLSTPASTFLALNPASWKMQHCLGALPELTEADFVVDLASSLNWQTILTIWKDIKDLLPDTEWYQNCLLVWQLIDQMNSAVTTKYSPR